MPNNEERQPLLKFEASNREDRVLLVFALVTVFVCVALYIAGVMASNAVLIALAIILALIAVIVGWMIKRSTSKNAVLSEEEIEANLAQYEQDLRDTFVGYSVDYTEADIKEAVEKRREDLLTENTRVKVENPAEVAGLVGKILKEERAESKSVKAEYKEAKKQAKAAKKAKRK